MIDIHTHILPCIDDGSKDVEESIKMLGILSAQGVDTVVATPHFYVELTEAKTFLKERNAAAEVLEQNLNLADFERPRIALGAEVQFYNELHMLDELEKLCITGTNYILIEMPFIEWTQRTYQVLEQLWTNRGVVPVVAHLERYPEFKKNPKAAIWLKESGAFVQINSDFICERSTRRRALKMIKNELVSFIGSDAHNTTTRPPVLEEAFKIINKKLKPTRFEYLNYCELNLKKSLITF